MAIKAKAPKPRRSKTLAYTLLKEWCDKAKFVPTATCLEHFGNGQTGLNRWQFGDAFDDLTAEGYQFDIVDRLYGYNVTRPEPKKDL